MELKMLFLVLLALAIWELCGACETFPYGLDDPEKCHDIRVKWLEVQQCAIVVGKITPPQSPKSVKDCAVVLGASSSSKLQFVLLTFDTFYINSCNVVLTILDSPSSVFDRDVKELAMLTCESPNPGKIFSQEGHHIKLSLHREDKYIRNYSFRINASLSAGPPQTGTSVSTIIAVVGIMLTVLIVGGGLLFKYIHTRWFDQQASVTPRTRHRFPYLYGSAISNASTQTAAANGEVHNGRDGLNTREGSDSCVPSSSCNLDNKDLPPPPYEEALTMPRPHGMYREQNVANTSFQAVDYVNL